MMMLDEVNEEEGEGEGNEQEKWMSRGSGCGG